VFAGSQKLVFFVFEKTAGYPFCFDKTGLQSTQQGSSILTSSFNQLIIPLMLLHYILRPDRKVTLNSLIIRPTFLSNVASVKLVQSVDYLGITSAEIVLKLLVGVVLKHVCWQWNQCNIFVCRMTNYELLC